MKQIINELFYSPIRVAVDHEIRSVIMTQIDDESLRANLLYHFHLDEDVKPTLDFSKRLRAYLCYLFAQEADVPFDEIVPLATTMELLHNSTLAIDDIQDNSESRCGRHSLWKRVGIPAALNAGYFLGLYSLQYYQEKRRIYNYYDHTVLVTQFIESLLCGQQKDIESANIEKTTDNYYAIACGKTGALLNMACLLGNMPHSFSEVNSKIIKDFSNSLAICYQILDDFNDMINGLTLDPSNIYYFSGNNDQPSSQKIQGIRRLFKMERNKLMVFIQRLHLAGVLRTNTVDEFICELLNVAEDGNE